jgi:FolB domain-containing protein
MDIVFIEQLSVITTIGVYDWEQTIEQKLVFDIEMAWDNRKAGFKGVEIREELTRRRIAAIASWKEQRCPKPD